MADIKLSPLMRDMLEPAEGDAAEALRLALNGVIGKYQLHASTVISLLARLSAGYIHLTQKMYDDAGADEVVEEDFENMLIAHLTDLDICPERHWRAGIWGYINDIN